MNLRDAILRIGVTRARRIAFDNSLGALFAPKPLKKLWAHSRSVANLAFQLARFCGTDAETAYVGGLMHDIGRLGLIKFPAEQRAAESNWLSAGFPRVYAETLAYGVDHAAVGAEILTGWELPERIVEGVAFHQRPGRSESLLGAMLYLADDLAENANPVAAHQPQEDLWSGVRRRIACERTGITLDGLHAFNEMRCTSQESACI
jgi:putative nucleotidyltransferase with HDIG domain